MKLNKLFKLIISVLSTINLIFLLFINSFSYTLVDGTSKSVTLFNLLFQRKDTVGLFPQESKGYIVFLTVLAVVLLIAIIFFIQFLALQLLNVDANSLGLVVKAISTLLNTTIFISLLVLGNNVSVVTLSNVYFLPFILSIVFLIAYIPLFIYGPKDKEVKK
jgi:hypothetical protein